jgi:hypothetical protein
VKKVELEHELEIATCTIEDLEAALKVAEADKAQAEADRDYALSNAKHWINRAVELDADRALTAKARDEAVALAEMIDKECDEWESLYNEAQDDLQAEDRAHREAIQEIRVLTHALAEKQGAGFIR